MRVLVTGAAGFIGAHLSQALLRRGVPVIGVDNFSPYYDIKLKRARLAALTDLPGFTMIEADISDRALADAPPAAFADVTHIAHLAAQPGVRHSLIDPYAYIQANVMGQVVMLELAKRLPKLAHFVYASSSSVYGGAAAVPFSLEDRADQPDSPYAATKRSDELIARTYAHLFAIPATGLRFFTVYGPWGRPDMAPILFADGILKRRPITVYNSGQMERDFTFIDDIVAGCMAALEKPPTGLAPPHRVFNLGNSRAEKLTRFIAVLEDALGAKAEIIHAPMQPGDVPRTFADISDSQAVLGYQPTTPIEVGLPKFAAWAKPWLTQG
jgi:UDP-glucuronate 4-epimerase